MNVLIKFLIQKQETKEEFLFWSCVLHTFTENVKFDYLNNNNIVKMENENYKIKFKYIEWTEEEEQL